MKPDHSQANWLESWTSLGVLGRGAGGEVLRVVRKGDPAGQHFALKRLTRSGPAWRERFARGAELLGRVRHPQVPRIVDCRLDLAEPYFVSELREGVLLVDRVRPYANRVPDLREACLLTGGLLSALDACHAVGVVHCDVKAQNLVIPDDDPSRPMLLDFDLAREVGEVGSLGVPAHPSVDLVHAALIFLNVLIGHFQLPAHWWGLPPHKHPQVARRLADMPFDSRQAATAFLRKAFDPSPDRRFQTAEEMRAVIEATMRTSASDAAMSADRPAARSPAGLGVLALLPDGSPAWEGGIAWTCLLVGAA